MIQIVKYDGQNAEALLSRPENTEKNVDAVVRAILDDVRVRGDEALYEYTERFDGAKLSCMRVTQEEMARGLANTPEELLCAMRASAKNIASYHQMQVRQGFVDASKPGIVRGQRVLPLSAVGLYVPGGTAFYPSSLLMNALPAKIAGVPRIVITTPCDKDGNVCDALLAAASIAGVNEIYKVGGAQAVAALCWGTESIPRVDKIVGPGNIYVATAKRMVYGRVDIDMIAGPSEILVIADEKSNPAFVAADLLSQAEHDKLASAWLVTDSMTLAKNVQAEVDIQLEKLPRRDIARASVDERGRIVVTSSMAQAVAVANAVAPEHLELCVDDPFALLGGIRNAASVFMGRCCPESLGDYMAGPNHTLPTGGAARFASPLSVDDFVKKSSYIYYTREALAPVADDIGRFARAEGLEAHARAALCRFGDAQ